jgi:hypothetical protein
MQQALNKKGILALKEEYEKRIKRVDELGYYNTDPLIKNEMETKGDLLRQVVKDLEALLK